MSTTTKNLSKSFIKGKLNAQRLPPIPITSDLSTTTTTNEDLLTTSILKHRNSLTEDLQTDDQTIGYDDDDLETPRIIFQKSRDDVLLLLDTYPSKTYTIPKCLKTRLDYTSSLNQNRTTESIFDTLLTSCDPHNNIIDPFPPPLSDRLPSSRYCRRSTSSACSRRSSILFPRHTSIPVDSTQLHREDTFDIVYENLNESIRSSYTPLPPIPIDTSSNLSKSLNIPTTDPQPSISPPLITTEDIPDIQEKKDEYTRHLLSKSLHRQAPSSSTEKTMEPSTIVNKTSVLKSVISPRLQKPVVETRRGNSVERHVPVASTKTKTSTTASTTSLNTNCQRLSNISMHIFQPQSKSNVASPVTNKKTTTVNTKTKPLTTHSVPKVKVVPTNSTKESISTANDVNFSLSSSSPSALLTVPNETYQVPKNVTKEIESSPKFNAEPVSSQMIHSSPNLARRDKCHSSASSSAHRHSYSVPQPLTLQGEKTVESDCLLTNSKPVASAVAVRQRRESIKIQPVITELFTDTTTDVQKPAMKSELSPSTNPSTMKMKKARPNIIKSAKSRKPAASAAPNKSAASNKSKITIKVTAKAEMKCQSTNTDTNEENQLDESSINADGTNALGTVEPQVVEDDELSLLQLFEVPTVDDEDIPTCFSPTDQLTLSQTTLMTSFGDIPRRNSIESVQALEISPVLTQNIEPSSEPISQQTKSNEHLLPHSIIRTIYETVQDSIRKDSSIRSKQSQSTEQEPVQDSIRKDSSIRSKKSQSTEQEPVQDSIRKDSSIRSKKSQSTEQEPVQDSIRKDSSIRSKQSQSTEQETTSMTNISTQNKTLPFDATISITQTYNNSDTGLSIRPALRVVIDSLNSRGSETVDSAGSHDDYSSTPLCLETDCDEIYRTGRKGKQVGKGAYGTVWSYLTITGRIIAVKEIELDEDDNERVRNDYQSVREEIHILQALNHPYIVKFLGISLENTRLAKIFMEYLPNGTIENLITSFGPFHNDVLKKYTNQIVEGIAYLHENNVVHRDIKGKNIMLDVDGNIKLIDFGCAKRLKQNQNTHSMRQILKSMKGTANWMAPEVIAETGHGKKADIWSIGCTLCEMATGKPPWSSEHNHLTVLVIIVNGTKPPADLPDTCPVTAQEFFRLCLTRDPISRPSAKDLLSHPFLAS